MSCAKYDAILKSTVVYNLTHKVILYAMLVAAIVMRVLKGKKYHSYSLYTIQGLTHKKFATTNVREDLNIMHCEVSLSTMKHILSVIM